MKFTDERKWIGSSDYATLVMVYCDRGALRSKLLHMSGDGDYFAYIVADKDVELPDTYEEVLSISGWLKIYDDIERTAEFDADTINVLRNGDRIIIRAVDLG